MNLKQQLEIQALVDGELAGSDRARVRKMVDQDRPARELFEELSWTSLMPWIRAMMRQGVQ